MTKLILKNLPTRNREFSNLKCLGLDEKKKQDVVATKTVKNHAQSSNSSCRLQSYQTMDPDFLNCTFGIPRI